MRIAVSDQPILALDVGGSSVKSALVEKGQRIVGNVRVDAIQSRASAVEILSTLAAMITGHLQNRKEIQGIAFAFPGPFDYEQGICLIQNQDKFDTLYGLDLSAGLKEILGMPGLEIRYRNDAEAAVLGEALYGAGAAYTRLLGLTLGTGLGSAFVADRKIITEGVGVPNHGWLYSLSYGAQRADDVFSTRGLLAYLRKHGIAATDVASEVRAADKNSQALAEAFSLFGADLGEFLQPFVSDFHAEAVLVTGGIAEAWDRFAPSLIQSLSIPVLRGILGTRAALFGAAALYYSY